MPGKSDFGKILTGPPPPAGQYFPGSKEYRAWDQGLLYRHGGTAAQRPAGDNPFDANAQPAERAAWADGWSTGDAMQAGQRFMPAASGAAPT